MAAIVAQMHPEAHALAFIPVCPSEHLVAIQRVCGAVAATQLASDFVVSGDD